MKVLYFHQHFTTPRGASGTRSYEFARHLIGEGHEVTMVCGSSSKADTGLTGPFRRGRREGGVEGIRVIELEVPYSNYDGFVKRAWAFLRFALRSIGIALREEYDVVFATSTPLTAGIPGIAARWLRRKPFVFEVRDLWPELPKAMGVITNPVVLTLMSWLEWASYHSAHRLIGLSPGIVEGIVRRGIDEDRVTMIPNGCDLELFDPKRYDRGAVDIPGVGPDDFVAAFTGAHGIANGLDAVLDAAAVLKDRGRNDIKIVFIGDGKLKPRLVARATEDGLDNCIFLDPVPKEELARMMVRVDVGLMILDNVPAFYRGTSPNKFFDYIASGTPVLNNYPGWLAQLIEEHRCGVAVEPGDALAFAECLEGAQSERDSTPQPSPAALGLARHFSRSVLADAFHLHLRRSVGEEPRRAVQDPDAAS